MKMKWQFMTALMGVTLLVLLVQDIPLGSYLRTVETDRLITALERDAFVLAGHSEEVLENTHVDGVEVLTQTARLYRDEGGARVVIVDAGGIAIVTSDDDQSKVGASYLSRPEIASALGGKIETGSRFSDTLQVELLYVTVPVLSGQEVLGAVRLTYPKQVVTDAVNRQLGVLSIVALTTVILAGIVGLIFATTITRRLKLLREATERFADGDLEAHADETTGAPEIRSLATSFNTMAARLSALIELQRTFAADASHQLRTPLTALRLRLERARELVHTDADAASTRLIAAEAEADRLGSIIEGLLLLSRAEAASAVRITVDLAATARDRVEHWQPLGAELGITVRYEGVDSALVTALATAPEQIIDNYIDNAITVSSRGDDITVTVMSEPGANAVHVLDRGPGMSEVGYERAFDRFWRGESDNRGNGLGLAIVAQLARASGGSARLAPRDGRGVDASATFPAVPPGP